MEERIKCSNCDNRILQQTALRHSGLCKPCFKQKLFEEISCTEFGIAYEAAFKRPPLKTKRYIDCWLDTSHMLGSLLFLIRIGRDCKYIFQNKTNVPDITSLHKWYLDIIQRFRERVTGITARNAREAADQQMLFKRADELQHTAFLGINFLFKVKPIAKE